jgi:hypothetical protein
LRKVIALSEVELANRAVQDYLYPDPLVRSKKYVIVPSAGNLWVGEVFCSRWTGPRETFEAMRFHLESLLNRNIVIGMSFGTVAKYGLHTATYVGVSCFSDYTDDSIAKCPVFPQYRFVVLYDKEYDVSDLKLMRTGSLGVLTTEEILETFKEKRVGNRVSRKLSTR